VAQFNRPLTLAALVCALGPACNRGSDAADVGVKDAGVKLPPEPELPVPIGEVIGALPSRPPAFPVDLGAAPGALARARPRATVDELTPAVWHEELQEDAPCRRVTYLFTRPTPDRLETMICALRPEYAHPAHFKAIEAAISDLLGKPEATAVEGFDGQTWRVPGYRLELRRDTRQAGEPELLIDLRGAREIEMP
jgi:hypothetical protein